MYFTCKLCNAQHLSTQKSSSGVFLLPETITTKLAANGWYFCCKECKNV